MASRWLRRAVIAAVVLSIAFVVTVLLRGPVSLPFDLLVNVGPAVVAPELAPPQDGKVRVVFLQHGLWRTAHSLGRLERSLRANGYEVVNVGYPSTEDRIEGHAARLREAVEARLAAGPVDELSFVGHSMGGLVIQEYLRRDDARAPHACVYLATPHRGAILADRRRHWFAFRLAMGERAAAQLVTSDAFHRRPIPWPERSGTVVGDVGEGNGSIPGRDDGTVGVSEATFDGCADSVTVPFGHTRIAVAAEVARQVLAFVRDRRFAPGG
ncbi:MAG: alpha/beta fold hydrolase [Planctomycetes bacterium]|nr:alpha/beta fold hydrolase [Planctomycetota bacterium]